MSAPWIVHQYPPSPYCEKLRRVLVRLELPFELHDYMPLNEEARQEVRAFADRVQHNQMPVLERDGEFLGDSFLITQQLLREYPDRAERIYPADPTARAVVHAFELTGEAWWLRPEGQHLTAEYQEMKGADHAARIVRNDLATRDIVLETWDAALAEHTFLTGENYNMADISVVSHMNSRIAIAAFAASAAEAGMQIPFDTEQWPLWDVDGDRYPNLRRWFDTCNAAEYLESAAAVS